MSVSSALSMNKSFRDSAIVLRTQNLGETDRIIVLCTREHGIVHAVAKGVRRSSSKFGARLEPFMLVDFSASGGKKLATISQVVTRRAYAAPIAADYGVFTVAAVICELAEQLVQNDQEAGSGQFSLLAGALSALARRSHSPYRILDSYIARSFSLAGWGLATSACGICASVDDLNYFSAEVGVLCQNCGRGNLVQRVTPISEDTPAYLTALKAGDWETVGTLGTASSLSVKSSRLMMEYAQWHLERPLKTLAILEKES